MDNHGMMIEGLIYLGSAGLLVPIAVRLGLGSVLGYLIAGCIIGPWGLKLVSDAESILTFAEIGVVLMLFVIGLNWTRNGCGRCALRYSAAAACRWPAVAWCLAPFAISSG